MKKGSEEIYVIDSNLNILNRLIKGKYIIRSVRALNAYRKIQQKQQMRKNDKRGHLVMILNQQNEYLRDLTILQRGYLIKLIPFVDYDNNPLKDVVKKHGESQYIQTKDLERIWRLDKSGVLRIMNLFIEKELFEKKRHPYDKRKTIYLPTGKFIRKGKLPKDTSSYHTKVFQKKVAEIIHNINSIQYHENKTQQKQIQVSALGILHAVAPYFHYQTYYLVKNPNHNILQNNETILEALKRLESNKRNKQQLCYLKKVDFTKIANISRPTFDRYIGILIKAGAVLAVSTQRTIRYIVHPDLMFRRDEDGQDEYTNYIRKRQIAPTYPRGRYCYILYVVRLGTWQLVGISFDQGINASNAASSVTSISGSCSKAYVKYFNGSS